MFLNSDSCTFRPIDPFGVLRGFFVRDMQQSILLP